MEDIVIDDLTIDLQDQDKIDLDKSDQEIFDFIDNTIEDLTKEINDIL